MRGSGREYHHGPWGQVEGTPDLLLDLQVLQGGGRLLLQGMEEEKEEKEEKEEEKNYKEATRKII